MLKIKRESKTGPIRLSQGISIGLSKEFLLALSAAVLFHLLFFFLIDIKEKIPKPRRAKNSISLSVTSEEEGTLPDRENNTIIAASELITKTLRKEKEHSLGLAYTFEPFTFHFLQEAAPPIALWLNALEKEELILKSAPRYYPEVECHPLGLLASFSPPEKELKSFDEKAARYQCLYEVCIEGLSGRVIFSRLLSLETPSEIRKKAEETLRSLQFPPSSELLVKGHIELIVTH